MSSTNLTHAAGEFPALVVVWSRDEPQRVGEVLLPITVEGAEHRGVMVGRGDDSDSEDEIPRLFPIRQRPGVNVATGPMAARTISRDQFTIHPGADGLELRNVGRRAMIVNGLPVDGPAQVRAGDLVGLQGSLLMLVTRRPATLPGEELPQALWPAFGEADEAGIIGESPAAWELRRAVARVASSGEHALLLGPAGAGAELVARGVHQASARAQRALVSADLGRIAEELIDAELFGEGEAPGLLGLVGAGTLVLERGDKLDEARQARLLAALGDARLLVSAAELPVGPLAPALTQRVEIPGLSARAEDIGQLITALVREASDGDEEAQLTLFHDDPLRAGHPRVDPRLVASLIHRDYLTHLRELEDLLWSAMMTSLGAGLRHVSLDVPQVTIEDGAAHGLVSLTREQIVDALERAGGSEDQAVMLLGLRNRYQLRRLIEKFGLSSPV